MVSTTLLFLVTGAWELVVNNGGFIVEKRPKGDGLYELRVTAHTNLPPEAMAKAVWSHPEYIQFVPHLKGLKILEDKENERVIYQQIKMPVVKDRDYTVRVKRSADTATRVYESHFQTENASGPAENEEHVRVGLIQGSWTISPDEAGTGTDVVYQLYSDPGKELPRWIVSIAQNGAAPDLVKAMITRAERYASKSTKAP